MEEGKLHVHDSAGEIKHLRIIVAQAVEAQNEFLKKQGEFLNVQKSYTKAIFWATAIMAAATITLAAIGIKGLKEAPPSLPIQQLQEFRQIPK